MKSSGAPIEFRVSHTGTLREYKSKTQYELSDIGTK